MFSFFSGAGKMVQLDEVNCAGGEERNDSEQLLDRVESVQD